MTDEKMENRKQGLPGDGEIMIEVINVTKKFGSHKALDQVHMKVPKGAIYGLVGPGNPRSYAILRARTARMRARSGSKGRSYMKTPR